MRTHRRGWRYGWVGVGLLVAMAGFHAAVPSLLPSLFARRRELPPVAIYPVHRTDLVVSTAAGGRVDSSNSTTVECELEALGVGVQGRAIATSGASTLLSIVDDGTPVKKGDVLAVLDASDYEELLETQQINVEQAQSDHRVAELNLEVARKAVDEYRDGTMAQMVKTLNGSIALARSDIERAQTRVEWAQRMVGKGYVPVGQARTEEFELAKQRVALSRGLTQLSVFRRFNAPMYLKILESEVKAAESMLAYQKLRLDRTRGKLEDLKYQVELCTIRAPHDGMAILANDDQRQVRVEPGITVRQHQKLLYLPDLSHMEVAAMLHESVAKDIKPGQRARVRIEALQGRELEGHVVAITQLPSSSNPFLSQVKYFTATVKLDTIPKGLLPGMSAEVEIETLHRHDVLAIPVEALTCDDGRDYCYVAEEDHLERREIKLGQNTRELLEVTEGLNEGENVVADASRIGGDGQVETAGEGVGD